MGLVIYQYIPYQTYTPAFDIRWPSYPSLYMYWLTVVLEPEHLVVGYRNALAIEIHIRSFAFAFYRM